MFTYKPVFSLLLSFSLCGMDVPAESQGLSILPRETVTKIVFLHGDMQSIGRFGQTCHDNYKQQRDCMLRLCKDPKDSACQSVLCSFVKDRFDNCTQALVLYAKKYNENPAANEQACTMFHHLWRHHDVVRRAGVNEVLAKPDSTLNDCLDIYAGNYAAKEMEFLNSTRTPLAQSMRRAVEKANSYKLKRLLVKKNVVAVKTLLLSNDLLVNACWSGDKYGRDDKYGFKSKGCQQDTVLECACRLGDVDVISQLISKKSNIVDALDVMMKSAKIELFDAIIRKNYAAAQKNRFFIWNNAVKINSYTKNVDAEQEVRFFEKIISLLFPGQVDAHDEYGRSLLQFAIEGSNPGAVKFLLKQDVNVDLDTEGGLSPLMHATRDFEITSLLLVHGADVNYSNAQGITALMFPMCILKCDKSTRDVIELLLESGADVNRLDEDGRSVVHQYARIPTSRFNNNNALELMPIFAQYNANFGLADFQGKTPFDYAQEENNSSLMAALLKFNRPADVEADSLQSLNDDEFGADIEWKDTEWNDIDIE